MHPRTTGPDYQDADGPAVMVTCPDCGQLEWWTQRETEDHGMCRASEGICPVCADADLATAPSQWD